MESIMQGDQYYIPFSLYIEDEEDGTIVKVPITDDMVSDLKITFGDLTKGYADGDIEFDSETEEWLFPLTSDESYSFPPYVKVSAQVFFSGDGDIIGQTFGNIEVTPAAREAE